MWNSEKVFPQKCSFETCYTFCSKDGSRIVSVGLWNFKFSGRKLVRILPKEHRAQNVFFFYFVNRHDAESFKTANFGFSRSIYYVKKYLYFSGDVSF